MKILKSPFLIFISLVLGIFFGIAIVESPFWIGIVSSFSEIYLNFIQMTVIPILITAIVSSLARLFKERKLRKVLGYMFGLMSIWMLTLASLSMLLGMFLEPGSLTGKDRAALGKIIEKSESLNTDLEISLDDEDENNRKKDSPSILMQLIPSNIFSSLASGKTLQLVFFSLVFGFSISFSRGRNIASLVEMMSSIFAVFQKIIEWAMLFLPLGLFCIISKQVAMTGFDTFLSMFKFLYVFSIAFIVIIIMNTIVVWKFSKFSLTHTFKSLLEPTIVAFSTRSSLASIPSCIKVLSNSFQKNRIAANLIVPISVTIGRYGNVLYFGLAGIYVAQIYNFEFGFTEALLYPIFVVFAGVATAGATGFSTLLMLSIVTTPLGLPLEALLIVFYAIDPVVDPLRTSVIVHTNLAVGVLSIPDRDRPLTPEEKEILPKTII